MSATGWIGFVLAAGLVSLVATGLFARGVLSTRGGTPEMHFIGDAIREGAHAFLHRQYRSISVLVSVVMIGLFALYRVSVGSDAAWRTVVAFVAGSVASAAAGYWGMFIAVRANVHVAEAARKSAGGALRHALCGGAAAGLPVAAASLLGVATLFVFFGGASAPRAVPSQLVGFAFGASFVALFAQLGGGIYTKAADIGADLVGKLEVGIPEDDPRNPAVIADLVGDNVGDCAGRGADIFQSAAGGHVGAMILGVALFSHFGMAGVLFPLVAGSFGLLASLAGLLVARLTRESDEPMTALNRGHVVTVLTACAGLYVSVRCLLQDEMWLFVAGLLGLAAGLTFAMTAVRYTGLREPSVRGIARSSQAGPAANVVSGLALGFESTALPVLTICVALYGAYGCGALALPGTPDAGLYGTAVATVGILLNVAYVLSADMLGPVVDNAGGIVEMSGEPASVRARTDHLDAAGNSIKAGTKGYAIGSAALTAFLLFVAYRYQVTALARVRFDTVDIAKLPVFLATLVGATVVFVFAGFAMHAVVRDARSVVEEVRRQLRERPGILNRTTKPDYARCVDIVTAGALGGMIVPGLLGVAAPVVIGLFFSAVSAGDRLLGAEAVAAALMAATIAGVLLASVMNTGGGAWDNAKKLVESGELGGKGSPVHAAAVVGDAVGDPLKDTAGPSLHVLIKLFVAVALVAAPLFV